MHAAFKTVSNAIELAMIASSTALMQACKRGAPSAGAVSLTECSAEVPCTSIRVAVHKLSVNKCMCCSQLYSMRSVDHVAGSATLVQGCERSFSGQGPVTRCTFPPSSRSRSLYGRHVSTSFLDPVFGP